MNQKLLAVLIASAFTLSACGGGDGGSNDSGSNSNGNNSGNGNNNGGQTTPPKTDPGTSTGHVVELLDTSHYYRILYEFQPVSGMSRINQVVQNDKGIITEFGDYQLKDSIVANEIEGNKNYALARIAKGTIVHTYPRTGESVTTDPSQESNGSYYYFAYTHIADKITADNKTAQCTDLHMTQAKRISGKGTADFILPSLRNGSMTIQPNGQFDIAFTVSTNGSETTYNGQMNWIEAFSAYNDYNLLGISSQSGTSNKNGVFAISKNGNNSYVMGAIYKITLTDQSQYQGLASMTCNF